MNTQSCTKISFTKIEAESALNYIRKTRRKSYRKEQRCYKCHLCNFWHLTSKPEITSTKITELGGILYEDQWKKLLNNHDDEPA